MNFTMLCNSLLRLEWSRIQFDLVYCWCYWQTELFHQWVGQTDRANPWDPSDLKINFHRYYNFLTTSEEIEIIIDEKDFLNNHWWNLALFQIIIDRISTFKFWTFKEILLTSINCVLKQELNYLTQTASRR